MGKDSERTTDQIHEDKREKLMKSSRTRKRAEYREQKRKMEASLFSSN
jgi:hypothetical protein